MLEDCLQAQASLAALTATRDKLLRKQEEVGRLKLKLTLIIKVQMIQHCIATPRMVCQASCV